MSGFSNPIVNAAGTLIKNVIKSVNYAAGSLGWQISKDGNAEFNLGSFRGSITVTGSNGSKIVIDAGAGYPTLYFYSKDGTNYSQLSLINAASLSAADLWQSSGQWTPADGIPRAIRLYMAGAGTDHGRLSVDRVSDGAILGGIVKVFPNLASIGYSNSSGIQNEINISSSNISAVTNATGGMFVDGSRITAGENAYNLYNAIVGSVAVGGYNVMPGMTNWGTIQKRYDNSRLIGYISGSFYSTGAAASGGSFGLQCFGQSNTWLAKVEQSNSTLNSHTTYSGIGPLTVGPSGGIPAGTYNISPIWGRTTGAGTLNVDGNDFLSFSIKEVG